jgi:hypothetical protein
MKPVRLVLCALALLPATAVAQSVTDLVVMRRPLAPPRGRPTPAPSAPATVTCSALTQFTFFDGTGPTVTIRTSGVADVDAALQTCNAHAATAGKGACVWNSNTKAAYYQVGSGTYQRTETFIYGTSCR